MNYRLAIGFVTLSIALAGCGGANLQSPSANQTAFTPPMQASWRTAHSRPAGSSSFQVVHTFQNGVDGGSPFAGLTADSKGNFYGTTSSGGSGYGTSTLR